MLSAHDPTRPHAWGDTQHAVAVDVAVGDLLPGVEIRRSRRVRRRVLTLRATSVDRGHRLRVKLPDRDDAVPELIGAAVATTLAIRERFGRMASGVHTIAIDDGAGTFDDHTTAGSAQSGTGTFFLDTSLAFADAISAQRQRMADRGGRSVSASVARPYFPIDGVVAHEYWHNLDTTVVATPAVYVEINRGLGEELGVETFEHTLRVEARPRRCRGSRRTAASSARSLAMPLRTCARPPRRCSSCGGARAPRLRRRRWSHGSVP